MMFSGNILEWKTQRHSQFQDSFRAIDEGHFTADSVHQSTEQSSFKNTAISGFNEHSVKASILQPSSSSRSGRAICPASTVWTGEKNLFEDEDNGYVLVDEIDDQLSHQMFYSTEKDT